MQKVRLIDGNALAESDMAKLIDKYLYNQCNLTVGLAAALMPEIKAEPVRHGKGCEYCKGRSYTKNPLTVTTRTMKRVEVCFNFCPNCGRDMRATGTNVGSKGGADNAGRK